MTSAESINRITAEVRRIFPEFQVAEDMEGLPTVIFGFLTDYLVRSFGADNTIIVKLFVDFIDDLSQSDDFIVRSCLDELIISLYSEAGDVHSGFKSNFRIKHQDFFLKFLVCGPLVMTEKA